MDSTTLLLIIGNGLTLICSTFAIIISIQNRKNVLRENLYNRQVDTLMSIHNKFVEIEDLYDDYFIEVDSVRKKAIQKKLSDFYMELHKIVDKNELLLDNDIYNATVDGILKTNTLIKQISTIEKNEGKVAYDIIMDLQDVYRSFIGTEKLSKTNRNLVK